MKLELASITLPSQLFFFFREQAALGRTNGLTGGPSDRAHYGPHKGLPPLLEEDNARGQQTGTYSNGCIVWDNISLH